MLGSLTGREAREIVRQAEVSLAPSPILSREEWERVEPLTFRLARDDREVVEIVSRCDSAVVDRVSLGFFHAWWDSPVFWA